MQILGLAFWVMHILWFSDTNMLVYPTQILALGVLPNVNHQHKGFCVAVDIDFSQIYGRKSLKISGADTGFLKAGVWVKGGFHETTKINKNNHRCIQSRRQEEQTCRHRLNLLFHNWSAGEMTLLVKGIVQCSDELNDMIALKWSRKYHCRLKFCH